MRERKIIIVGDPDVGKVCEILKSHNIESSVVVVDDFRELEQDVFEMQPMPIAEKSDPLLPTKKELQDAKMKRFRNRRKK